MDHTTQPDDLRFMNLALALAREAGERGEVPVGAIVVADGTIVGQGSNRVIRAADPTAHAEICALREAATVLENYRIPGATLYVTLEPCPMCAGAMVLARVRRLVFGAADPKTGAAGSVYQITDDARLNQRIQVSGGVLGAEASQLLTRFFEERRTPRDSANPPEDSDSGL